MLGAAWPGAVPAWPPFLTGGGVAEDVLSLDFEVLASSVPGAWGCSAEAAEGAGPAPGPGSAPAGWQCCSAATAAAPGSQGGSGGWKAGDVSFLFTVPHRRGVAGKSRTFTPKLQREERVNTAGSHPQVLQQQDSGCPTPRQTPTCKAATRKAPLAAQHHDVKASTGCRTPGMLRHATGFGLSPQRDKLNVSEQTTQLHLETNIDDNEVRALRISHVITDVSLHSRVAPHYMYSATRILFLSHTLSCSRDSKKSYWIQAVIWWLE